MKLRVVVLGAGFGGLELSTMLSEVIGDRLDMTLIDKSDFFACGFSRNITFVPKKTVTALDPAKNVVIFDDNSVLPYDLYLGVPKHCVPEVVASSGMTEDGWIVPNAKNLKTKFPGVYAVGDVTRFGPPKAGFFAEGAARVAARTILAEFLGGPQPADYDGAGNGALLRTLR